jgi:hypothetical protein
MPNAQEGPEAEASGRLSARLWVSSRRTIKAKGHPMTNEQCIQRLARRLGWDVREVHTRDEVCLATFHNGTPNSHYNPAIEHELLNSIDSIRPVLATMTTREKQLMVYILTKPLAEKGEMPTVKADCILLGLTLDPQQLAFAIAEAIGEEK